MRLGGLAGGRSLWLSRPAEQGGQRGDVARYRPRAQLVLEPEHENPVEPCLRSPRPDSRGQRRLDVHFRNPPGDGFLKPPRSFAGSKLALDEHDAVQLLEASDWRSRRQKL